MVEIPTEKKEEKKRTITEGEMEWEVYLDKEQMADFLIALGGQLKKGDTLTISTKNWEIPFEFREPIELEIEFEGYGERELEIEIEFKGKLNDKAPDVS